MNGETVNPLVDIAVKIGLLGLGAIFGALISAYTARIRLQRLLRNLLRQLHATVRLSQSAFSPEEAALCIPQLESAAKLLQDFVAAGIKNGDWNVGLACLERTTLAASRTASTPASSASGPATLLRSEAESLAKWLATVA
jgi:hypothetical protein